MDSRVTFKEIIAMCLVIVSFAITGIMIMNEDYKYALIALCGAAFCVLLAFIAVIIGDSDKILDLSNPNLRNPRKSNNGKKVTYISRLTPDISSGKGLKKKRRELDESNSYSEVGGDFYESVGNMRVYQRGEEIEYNNEEDDDYLL